MGSTPWYADGLAFGCTGCGHCCTGAPGYVWVDGGEIEALARRLHLDLDEFGRRYLRRTRGKYALLERPNGDCVFWQEGPGCTVYEARPRQCRTFPFWPENLKDRPAWKALKADCPGIGQGRIFPLEEIRLLRRGEGNA